MTHATRRLLSILVTAALVLTAAVRPAMADRKDALKVLGGLAALYVLNEALERNRESRDASGNGRIATQATRGQPHAGGFRVHSHDGLGEHAHLEGSDHEAAHAGTHADLSAPVLARSARPVMRPRTAGVPRLETTRLPAPGEDPLVAEVRRALERDSGGAAGSRATGPNGTVIAAPAPLPPSPYGPRPVEDPSAGAVPITIPSLDDRSAAAPKLLPERCATRVSTAAGSVSGYEAACMQASVARPGSLPPSCLARHETDQGPRALYTPSCLVAEGWSPRTAGR